MRIIAFRAIGLRRLSHDLAIKLECRLLKARLSRTSVWQSVLTYTRKDVNEGEIEVVVTDLLVAKHEVQFEAELDPDCVGDGIFRCRVLFSPISPDHMLDV